MRGGFGGNGSRVIALATMAAYAAMGRMDARGQQVIAEMPKESAPVQLPVRRFHIVAGQLDAALEGFRQQSGVALKLEIPEAQLAGFHTGGVQGLYTTEAALRALLAGTGLSFSFEGAAAVSVGLHHADTVDVTAQTQDAVSMGKFTESLIDTPQTIAVVPEFVLHDQQNRTLTDAIRNVPGISLAAGESGAQGDNLTIRGFTARNDIFLDGIRDFGSYYRDSFNDDQVEVLEGPAGVEFGRGSTGGVINQESKVPAADKFVRVDTEFGTDATRRITADINEPLADTARDSAFRVNMVATEGGVAGRPYAENRRFGLAPSISFGMNKPARLTISYFHFTESDTPDYGLPWFFNQLAPGVNRHAYFGFPDANYLRTNDDIVTLKANHTFTGNVDVHTIARWANYPRDVQITEPQICSNAGVSVPVGGYVAALPTSAVNSSQPCAYGMATPPTQIAVNRNQIKIKSVESELWDQTEVTTQFKLAGVRNDFAGGVEGGQEISNPIKYSYTENSVNSVPATNLADPNPNDVFGGRRICVLDYARKVEERWSVFRGHGEVRSLHRTFGRRSLGLLQYAVQPLRSAGERCGGQADDRDSVYRSDGAAAELSRGACLQADIARQRVLRLRDELQSIGGVAVVECGYECVAAGGERDVRGGREVWRDARPRAS